MRCLIGSQWSLVWNRGDVTDDRGSGDDTGSCVMDQLVHMEEFVPYVRSRRDNFQMCLFEYTLPVRRRE